MTFYKGGAKKRRDQNEPEIIATWRAYGAKVWQVSGRGLPDLLVKWRRRLKAYEVKTRTGKRTAAQKETEWPILRNVTDVLREVGSWLE